MLENIRVASPCSANWESMQGDGKVRFCSECKKNVYNLSSMSRTEAEQLLSSGQSICGRYYQREDGTILTEDCPVGLREKAARVRRPVSFAISGWIGIAAAFAQSPQNPERLVQIEQNTRYEFRGVITDSPGAVIPGATITLTDEKSKTKITARSNEAGEFRINAPRGIYGLSIDFPGFRSFKKEAVTLSSNMRLEVKMEVGATSMGVIVEAVAGSK